MQQRARLKALDRFKAAAKVAANGARSAHSVLVATDVAARGLDVKGVESVIHHRRHAPHQRSTRTFTEADAPVARICEAPRCLSSSERALEVLLSAQKSQSQRPAGRVPGGGGDALRAEQTVSQHEKDRQQPRSQAKGQGGQGMASDERRGARIALSESESDEDLQEPQPRPGARSASAAADERTLRAELAHAHQTSRAHRHSLIGSAKFPTRGGGDALIRAERARALEEDAVSPPTCSDGAARRAAEKKARRALTRRHRRRRRGRRHGQTSQEVASPPCTPTPPREDRARARPALAPVL